MKVNNLKKRQVARHRRPQVPVVRLALGGWNDAGGRRPPISGLTIWRLVLLSRDRPEHPGASPIRPHGGGFIGWIRNIKPSVQLFRHRDSF